MNFGKSMHLKDITILIYSVSSTQNVIIISKNVYIMEDYYHNIVIILNQDEVHIALQQSNVAKCNVVQIDFINSGLISSGFYIRSCYWYTRYTTQDPSCSFAKNTI